MLIVHFPAVSDPSDQHAVLRQHAEPVEPVKPVQTGILIDLLSGEPEGEMAPQHDTRQERDTSPAQTHSTPLEDSSRDEGLVLMNPVIDLTDGQESSHDGSDGDSVQQESQELF